ncbi:MAG: hypothetical protein KME26_01175 [Oscillatoria princeps RMCB-10]|nr:hypothetical protein [Oscillatoria princeps RMCB-10]
MRTGPKWEFRTQKCHYFQHRRETFERCQGGVLILLTILRGYDRARILGNLTRRLPYIDDLSCRWLFLRERKRW